MRLSTSQRSRCAPQRPLRRSHLPERCSRATSLILLAGFAAACSDGADSTLLSLTENAETDPDTYAPEPDGSRVVWYRGHQRVAETHGELLLIEGDIEVMPADIWGGPEGDPLGDVPGELGRIQQPVRIQGETFRWEGPVPFVFGTTNDLAANGTLAGPFTAGDKANIEAAMDEWETAVPELSFVPRTNQPDFITFNFSTVCSSPVGRGGGSQIIRLTSGCAGSHSVHHEIAHSLGLFLQHTRKDRNTFVTINWNFIRGCNNTATGPTTAQGCGVLPPGSRSRSASCHCVSRDTRRSSHSVYLIEF